MKFIIIGLGNFGSSLAKKLTDMGHEVIGVDNEMNKVEAIKDKVTYSMCMDCTDQNSIVNLPLSDTDVVIICIGEDEGANLMATALMKKMKVKRLISRAVNALHETILEAMGIIEIVHPEEETADRWSNKLNLKGVVNSFQLNKEFQIIEVKTPHKLAGRKISDINFITDYNLMLITIIKTIKEKNILGASRNVHKIEGVPNPDTILTENDYLLIFGMSRDIKELINDYS